MQLKILLTVFSLTACGTVPRPDANICIADFGDNRQRLVCYNLKNDFDQDGQIKAGTRPKIILMDSAGNLDRFTVMAPDDWAEFKAYVQQLKDRYKDCK